VPYLMNCDGKCCPMWLMISLEEYNLEVFTSVMAQVMVISSVTKFNIEG
jgi:hypothetical protein